MVADPQSNERMHQGVELFSARRVMLLDQPFRVTVELEEYDHDNHYYWEGVSISFRYDDYDNKVVVRGNAVDFFHIDYMWYQDRTWIIHEKSTRWENNSLKQVKVMGWMKKYFEEFLRQFPNWREDFPKAAIAYMNYWENRTIDNAQKTLDQARENIAKLTPEMSIKDATYLLRDYRGWQKRV